MAFAATTLLFPSPSFSYSRREPQKTILYQTIQKNYETFLHLNTSTGCGLKSLPSYVHEEIHAYLRCGILAHGFSRLRCETCKEEQLIAFSCKKRGFCPSCGGKRMNEVAAHLVDSVLPHAPIRQWVLSLPFSVRYLLAYKPNLVTGVLSIYVRAISTWIKKRARLEGVTGKTGAITFIQRFGGAINLNVHFHSLFLDGVYYGDGEKLKFHAVPAPTNEEIAVLVSMLKDRILKFLAKKGFPINDFSEDPLAIDQPVLSQLSGASIHQLIAVGERAGKRVRKVGADPAIGNIYQISRRCAATHGFSLHANTKIEAHDRKKLEKLCRYTARPPIAMERLSETENGKLLYKLKTPYRNGTTHILLDPLELVEKVVALIPPPKANLLRYHGVFAPHAKERKQIIPTSPESNKQKSISQKPNRSWSMLLKRSFAIDVMTCPSCSGNMRLISHIEQSPVISRILNHLGLPTSTPPVSSPRAPPQAQFIDSQLSTHDDFYQPSF